jgi:hypothetical protein
MDASGKYTVWATRKGKKVVSQRCATMADVIGLKADWEAFGYEVQVIESERSASEAAPPMTQPWNKI